MKNITLKEISKFWKVLYCSTEQISWHVSYFSTIDDILIDYVKEINMLVENNLVQHYMIGVCKIQKFYANYDSDLRCNVIKENYIYNALVMDLHECK